MRTRDVAAGRLLLVRGFPSELAWSEPTTTPRLSLLACTPPGLLYLRFDTDSAASAAMDQWSGASGERGELILATPLRDGTVFGQDPPRDDSMYGWNVERLAPAPPLPPGCSSTALDAYRLTFRTFPDHQIVEWRDGVGITAFVYGHHGTPAGADVRLVACSRR